MKIQERVPLATLTTLRTGGEGRFVFVVETTKELQTALQFCKEKKLPYLVLGGGSNVLCEGWDGVVIQMQTNDISFSSQGEEVEVSADAGVVWDTFVQECVERGLWGIENLSGIPGTTGATPIQNVGAYGTEVSQVIDRVVVLNTTTNEREILSNKECAFGYRSSFFKTPEGKNYIILSVVFHLSQIAKPNLSYRDLENYFQSTEPSLAEIREAVLTIRSKKFPALTEYGTAGSFFKNPIVSIDHYNELQKKWPALPSFPVSSNEVKVPLAWILEHVCEVKGVWFGSVGLYEHQPLVLVTKEGATFSDVIAVLHDVQKKVFEKTKIKIENEVTIVKNFL